MQDSRPTPDMVGDFPDQTTTRSSGEAGFRARLAEGTEHLTEAARERVIAAREQAVRAQRQARDAVSHGGDAAADMFERQPLVVGALAFAVGAAVAAMLPRTRTENSYLGARRDQLMDEAERIFHEETERAKSTLRTAESEARAAVSDVTDTVAQKAREATDESAAAVKDAASDVKSTAKTQAKKAADDVKKAH